MNTKVEAWVAGNERLAASQTPRDPTLRPSSQQLSQQVSLPLSGPLIFLMSHQNSCLSFFDDSHQIICLLCFYESHQIFCVLFIIYESSQIF